MVRVSTCVFLRCLRSVASPGLDGTVLLGNSASGLRLQARPPGPGWSPAAAAGLMRGRGQGAEEAAADWPWSCRAGRKGAGCRRMIGTNQGCAGRVHLGAKKKKKLFF